MYVFEDSNRFTDIVDGIRASQHQSIIYTTINFKELQKSLLKLIVKLNIQPSQPQQNAIITCALNIWTIILEKEPELIKDFYEWKDESYNAREFLFSGVYSFKAEEIRKAFEHTFT